MNIGIMTINDFEFHPNGRLREAAEYQGHRVTLMNPYQFPCGIADGNLHFLDAETGGSFDVVMPRQGALIGDYGLALILQFMNMGVPVINDVHGIRITRDQYLTLQALSRAGVTVPDSMFVTTEKGFREAVEWFGGYPVVAKQVNSWGGRGVILVENERLVELISEHMLEERKGLVVQRFIPPEGRRDIRVLVIGRKIAGAMELRPKPGDFRANVHLNGAPGTVHLSEELSDMAMGAAGACGLEIAGVDIIMDRNSKAWAIEVNHAPGFRGLEEATGKDIATRIVDHAVRRFTVENRRVGRNHT